ncbi:c2H2-type domain-containing protein [Trichonephila clavipes]|nr:c2H2-type domain-containing protein [Trichonephila clavipes]
MAFISWLSSVSGKLTSSVQQLITMSRLRFPAKACFSLRSWWIGFHLCHQDGNRMQVGAQKNTSALPQQQPLIQNNHGRLKEGVSENFFLQDIREEITVASGRKMLIGEKVIHNIKRDFNINGYAKRHEFDAVSVKLWSQEMKNNGENCIVFFFKE